MARRLVRASTISRLTGIPKGTIGSWRSRGQFPEPDQIVDGVPVWWWPDVGVAMGALPATNPLVDHLEQLGR